MLDVQLSNAATWTLVAAADWLYFARCGADSNFGHYVTKMSKMAHKHLLQTSVATEARVSHLLGRTQHFRHTSVREVNHSRGIAVSLALKD